MGLKKITDVLNEKQSNPVPAKYGSKTRAKSQTKHALDRIDPQKGYFPSNCRWISVFENSNRVVRGRKRNCYFDFKSSESKSHKEQSSPFASIVIEISDGFRSALSRPPI